MHDYDRASKNVLLRIIKFKTFDHPKNFNFEDIKKLLRSKLPRKNRAI